MKALIVSLESFQKGTVPDEVMAYIKGCEVEPFIVLDESSKIKTNAPCKATKKSKRTQAVLKLNNVGERCILTGTFMSKTPVNAYDQMNFLCDDFFPESMSVFADKYEVRKNLVGHRGTRVVVSPRDWANIRNKLLLAKSRGNRAYEDACYELINYFGLLPDTFPHILANESYTPFKHLDSLWERIGKFCFKVDKEDVFKTMPAKVYQTINVEFTKEQKKLYEQLQNMQCTDEATVTNGLELYLRFQDICNGYRPVDILELGTTELVPLSENPKLEVLYELIESIGDEQIIVWCSRTKLIEDAYTMLNNAGYKCGMYTGKTKETREVDYERFRIKDLQILLCNQASAGYGLDGLKEADYAIYLCNSYSVEQRQQSEDRIHRGNVTRVKHIIDITCKGTCEDRVTQALKQGKELVSKGKTDVRVFTYKEEGKNGE